MWTLYFIISCFIQLGLGTNGYNVGTGISDITGPAVEVNFMGYAAPAQTGKGIHMRLFARAYVVDDGTKRFAFVSLDGCMGSDLITQHVVQTIQQALNDDKTYTVENVCISGTHTHSGPGGFLQYVLYDFTSLGFVHETFEAFVSGISQAILKAHANLNQGGRIFVNQGELSNSNINRSPTSYLLNPDSERKRYNANTDLNMLLLRFMNANAEDVGVLNWFAVHGTSMNNTNRLISGDNRGYAAQLLERAVNGPTSEVLPGQGKFVSAFAATNLGDVSPNTEGPHCMDTGKPCDLVHSTCNGKNEMCVASGPGKDMFESTKIIGELQFNHSSELLHSANDEVTGAVDFRHSFVDMPKLTVTLSDGTSVQLCKPAMGYAFAAGTTDGPGMFDFTQGTNSSNPFWNLVSGLLSKPTKEEIECQAPKPILLNTGDIEKPYDWDPHIVPFQLLRVGHIFIAAVPFELTTMAGRRARKTLQPIVQKLVTQNVEAIVTIAGLANSYASYTTTFEEYQGQRYEAASTIYGPHQLEAVIQELTRLANDMVAGRKSQTGAAPPDLLDKQIELLPGVVLDRTPIGKDFGDVLHDVSKSYSVGDVASVTFQGANPRNEQKLGGTFLTVEQKEGSSWKVVAVDADFETKFMWEGSKVKGTSEITVEWEIPTEASGTFRMCHSGNHKNLLGKITAYSGCSSQFIVGAAN